MADDEDRGRYVIVRVGKNGTEVVSAFEHRHWALKNDTAGFTLSYCGAIGTRTTARVGTRSRS